MANLGWKSPFEVLHGSAPNLEDLRAIGYLCYATKVGQTDKFEARAQKCVLLGYTFGFKGYKLYDLQTKKVFHSRDVLFQEQTFPFRVPSQSSRTDVSHSSFLSPNSEVFLDSPRYFSPTSSSVPMPSNSDSLQSEGSTTRGIPAQVPDSSASVNTDNVPCLLQGDSSASSLPEDPPPDLKRSARPKVAPIWLKNFVQPRPTKLILDVSSSSHSYSFHSAVVHPLLHTEDFSHFSQNFVTSLMSVLQTLEPHSYSQAKNSPEWVAAMDKEPRPWRPMVLGD